VITFLVADHAIDCDELARAPLPDYDEDDA
jgi:hypothetical protein